VGSGKISVQSLKTFMGIDSKFIKEVIVGDTIKLSNYPVSMNMALSVLE
jgi:hypothetical protein